MARVPVQCGRGAGPFETAFQDVLGVTIFLSLATALLHWLA